MKRRTFFIIVILVGVLASLFFARKLILKQALPKVEKVVLGKVSITNDSAFIHMLIVLKNRALTTYTISGINIDVRNDTLLLVHYNNLDDHSLVSFESQSISFDFAVPIKKIIHQIRELQGQDSTYLSVKGWLDFTTTYGTIRIPLDEFIQVSVPIPPKVDIQQVIYTGRNDDKNNTFDFRLKARVINLGDKEFRFKNIKYDFYGEKLIESHGVIQDLDIPPQDSVYIDLPVQVKVNNEMKLLYKIVFDKDVIDYNFVMNGTIVSLAGFQQEAPASFRNTGKVELYDPGRKKMNITVRKKNKKKKKAGN